MALPTLITGGPLIAMQAAIQARLQAAFPPAQCGFEMIPARLTKREYERVTRRSPTLALGWIGITPPHDVGRAFRGDAEWLLVIALQKTGPVSGRIIGDVTGPGLLGAVQLAIANLHGWTITAADVAAALAGAAPIGSTMNSQAWVAPVPSAGNVAPAATGIGTVTVREVSNLWSDEWGADDHVLAGLRLTVNTTFDDPDATSGLADWLRLGMTWQLAPSGDEQADPAISLGSNS